MKKFILLLLLISSISTNAQDIGVEKSTYGIQAGFLGFWIHNESKLTNLIALRTEIGFDCGLFLGTNFFDVKGFITAPVITAEPRWYYNLNKRNNKSLRIDGNSGNFISIKTSFQPDWFTISNANNVRVRNNISIVPTWGIRRHIGDHLTYESGLGIGYQRSFSNQTVSGENQIALNLHLRIGYRF